MKHRTRLPFTRVITEDAIPNYQLSTSVAGSSFMAAYINLTTPQALLPQARSDTDNRVEIESQRASSIVHTQDEDRKLNSGDGFHGRCQRQLSHNTRIQWYFVKAQ